MMNRLLLSACSSNFQLSANHFLYIFNYFQTRLVKTALGKTALTECYFITTKASFKTFTLY
jgi:hypothetical protein